MKLIVLVIEVGLAATEAEWTCRRLDNDLLGNDRPKLLCPVQVVLMMMMMIMVHYVMIVINCPMKVHCFFGMLDLA